MATVITAQGQVTVPKAMRDKLGRKPGRRRSTPVAQPRRPSRRDHRDFLIGAHAVVRGWPPITRDRRRFAG